VTRHERLIAANELLCVIASHGRKFFHHEGRIAYFEVDQRGRVWFTDEYTGKKIYVAYGGRWRGFSHGGTMRDLVDAMRIFIVRGTKVGHFGPWPAWYSGGDPWGYGEDFTIVRAAAVRLGLTDPDPPRTNGTATPSSARSAFAQRTGADADG